MKNIFFIFDSSTLNKLYIFYMNFLYRINPTRSHSRKYFLPMIRDNSAVELSVLSGIVEGVDGDRVYRSDL